MTVIRELLEYVELGEPRTFAGLTVFPLLGRDGSGKKWLDYIRLEEALEAGTARITEVSEGGSVPDLRFANDGERHVLLIDGAALIGAKQNRVLNLTILAPSGKTIVIPVSCCESGRWHRESAAFEAGDHAMYAAGRAMKMAQVSSSMEESGARRSKQGAVWSDIKAKMLRLSTSSPSEAMNEMFNRHRERLEAYTAEFAPEEGQIGLLIGLNGKPVGLDLFDRTDTLRGYLPTILRSYALDAIELTKNEDQALERDAAERFLGLVVEAKIKSYEAVGLGEDLRLESDGMTGGALVVDGVVVHLGAFKARAAA